jgi:hypothetical protein
VINNNQEIGLNAYMQDLFDNTGLMDRIRKNPDQTSKNELQLAFERDLRASRSEGYNEGHQDAILVALNVLSNLNHRAGRKSCVAALREHFKVEDSE